MCTPPAVERGYVVEIDPAPSDASASRASAILPARASSAAWTPGERELRVRGARLVEGQVGRSEPATTLLRDEVVEHQHIGLLYDLRLMHPLG
jgi:hypothetical protein